MASQKSPIKNVIVMMFENRSFYSMLGFLYENNVSPLTKQPFEGLTGHESNPGSDGKPVPVFKIDPSDPYAYNMPRKDPGEGFANTNSQLFGAPQAPFDKSFAPNQGFVIDFGHQIKNDSLINMETAAREGEPIPKESIQYAPDLPGVSEKDIMGMYTPKGLPVLSKLAQNYAVCDHWYCSAPTETLPNRAFTHMGTSEGNLYDELKSYTSKSIFMHLVDHGKTWGIIGNNGRPYTLSFSADIPGATIDKKLEKKSLQSCRKAVNRDLLRILLML